MGRDSQNDLALPNDSKVSRRHAIVRQVGSTYLIEDLQSRNGTYLERGVTVTRITSPLQLEPNDVIRVGSARLVFDLETAGAAPAPPEVRPAPDATPAPVEAGPVTTEFVVGKTVVGRVVPIMGGPTPFGAPAPKRPEPAARPAAPAQTAPRTLPEALRRIAELEQQVAALEAELARLKGHS